MTPDVVDTVNQQDGSEVVGVGCNPDLFNELQQGQSVNEQSGHPIICTNGIIHIQQ
jgi:hypothetical protein